MIKKLNLKLIVLLCNIFIISSVALGCDSTNNAYANDSKAYASSNNATESQKQQEDAKKIENEKKAKEEADAKAAAEAKAKQEAEQQTKIAADAKAKQDAEVKARQEAESKEMQQVQNNENKSYTVYGTKTGDCYHRDGCRYLNKSKIPMSIENAKKSGLRPCSVCKP